MKDLQVESLALMLGEFKIKKRMMDTLLQGYPFTKEILDYSIKIDQEIQTIELLLLNERVE